MISILEICFYLTCFFPFIVIGNLSNGSDVQPYCLILSLFLSFYFLTKKNYFWKKHLLFYGVLLSGIIIGTLMSIAEHSVDTNSMLRYISTYLGIITISYVSYSFCERNNGYSEVIVKSVINIWGIVGLIQLWINRNFAYGIVANPRTSGNRGVISLASEPSYYGAVCVLLLILTIDFKRHKIIYQINLLIQILFIAKSSVAIVYLLCYAFLLFVFSVWKANWKALCGIVIIFMVGALGLHYLLAQGNINQRALMFARWLLEANSLSSGLNTIIAEHSVSVRLNDILFCLSGFINSWGMPYGFQTRKINSGYGSLAYTMGWLGIWSIAIIYRIIREAYAKEANVQLEIVPIFITIIMFSNIQLSNPIFPFLIGYCLFRRKMNMQERNIEKI